MASVKLVQGNPIVLPGRESGAGTFSAGDLVQLDSNGYVAIGATTTFCGIARKTESTSANTACEWELLSPYNVYEMKGVAGTAIAQTDVGDGFVVTFTEGAHYITVGTDSDGTVIALADPVGTSGGRYWVKFYDSVIKTGEIG
jgi:hypothetical protein